MERTPKTDVFLARPVRGNRGDFANQGGVLEGLLRSPYVGQVFLSTFYPHHFKDNPRITPVGPAPVRGYLTTAEESTILRRKLPVFWGGGVDLQDSGSKLKIVLLWLRITLLKRFGSPFFLSFQGAGPVRTGPGKFFLRRIARLLNVALVREPTAYKVLVEDGHMKPDQVETVADGALLLDPPDLDFGREYLESRGFDLSKPIIGVNLRRWFHQKGGWLPTEFSSRKEVGTLSGNMERLVDNVAAALKTLGSDYSQFVMMPMYRTFPEGFEDDSVLLAELAKRLPEGALTVRVDEDLSSRQLLSIFGALSLMVGVRLHSTIMAHIAGTPAVHIYYEHKGKEHFELMGMQQLMMSIDDASLPSGADELARLLQSAVERQEELEQEVHRKVIEQRTRAQDILDAKIYQVVFGEQDGSRAGRIQAA